MSIKFINNLELDIYIKKYLIENVDFEDIKSLEKYLKSLFKKLNKFYNINIEGFYNITIYKDKYYGILLHIEKEKLEYYEYYKNQVDMRITTKDIDFMYLVDDIPKYILNKINIVNKNGDIYISFISEPTKHEMMNLVENSKIVF